MNLFRCEKITSDFIRQAKHKADHRDWFFFTKFSQ